MPLWRTVFTIILLAVVAGPAAAETNEQRLSAAAEAYQRFDFATVREKLDPYLEEIPNDRFARLMNGIAYIAPDQQSGDCRDRNCKSIEHLEYILSHFSGEGVEGANCDARAALMIQYDQVKGRADLMVNEAYDFAYACRCHPMLRLANAIIRAVSGNPNPTGGPPSASKKCYPDADNVYVATAWIVEVPTTMEAGKSYPVMIRMKNPREWDSNDQSGHQYEHPAWWWAGAWFFRLGSKHDHWRTTRAWLHAGEIVQENTAHDFTFMVTAPSKPGVYPFQWQMVIDGANGRSAWFGNATPLKHITVTAAPCVDTVPPAVTITSPRAGKVTKPSVALEVSATDDHGVVRVEYSLDGQSIASGAPPSFAVTADLSAFPAGTHTLVAKAVDICNNSIESAAVAIDLREDPGRPPVARNDRASTKRDTPVTVEVLANDREKDGQPIALTETAVTRAARNGTAVRASDRSVTYTPNAGWTGNDVFEYEIADSAGKRDRAFVTVHVGRSKAAPVAAEDSATTRANQSIPINVVANDSSPEGLSLALSDASDLESPGNGTVTRLSDSTLVYTPAHDFVGYDSFEYAIDDGDGGIGGAYVTVLVEDGNAAPVAVDDSATTGVGQSVSIDVTANDSDPDGESVALTSAPITGTPQHGTALRVSASRIAYTPDGGFVGTDTFRYAIGDGHGRQAEAAVVVTVSNTNHAPDAEDDVATTVAGTAVTVDVTANDHDADGNKLSLTAGSIVTPPANGTAVRISSSSMTYTPRNGFAGTDRFQYRVSDSLGATDSAWVTVTINSDPPNHGPVAMDDEATTKESTSIEVAVTANDSDPDGDAIWLVATPVTVAPAHGSVTRVNDAKLRYVPAADYVGVDTLQYEIGDGSGTRSRAWLRITVRNTNSRPRAVDDAAATKSGQAVTVTVTGNDSDPDGDPIRLLSDAISVAANHGSTAKLDANSIRYTPAAGFSGVDRFRYEIGDGRGGRHEAWVNVTVSAASNGLAAATHSTSTSAPPAAGNDQAEGLSDTSVDVVVVANDFQTGTRPLILTANPVVTAPLNGSVVKRSDTTLTYTPFSGFEGNDRFEYEATDGSVTARAWVTVQVPGLNLLPVAVQDDAALYENGSLAVMPLDNDRDPDGDALELTLRAVTIAPVHGKVQRADSRTLVYTPAADFAGQDVFTYEITDHRGGTAEARIVLQIVPESRGPAARDDAASADSGIPLVVNVLANDRDPLDLLLDPLGGHLRVTGSDSPQHGSLVWNEDGTATYQSDYRFTGSDSFQYTVSDARGLTAQARVTISVAGPPNHAPIVVNDAVETATRTPVLIGVIANDADLDYGQKLTVKSVSQPGRGSVIVNKLQSVTYTPANDFAGTDTFTYTVSDGIAAVEGTVTVTVVNGPPNARSEILAAREDQATPYYPSISLLNNDTDPDGDELAVTQVEQPVHGTIQVAPDFSTIVYTSPLNWSGLDTFHYTVSDPFGESVRVMSSISVSAVNDAPVAGNDSFTMYNNQVLTLTQAQVVANDTDLEGHAISVYSVDAPANGTAEKLPDGSIRYEPYGSFVGTDSFKYRIEDSAGGAYADGVITVTVLSDTKPVAGFTFTCNYLVCSFDASASTDDRGITAYQWTMGDGFAASGKTFTHTYGGAGTYTARVTVYDELGQTGTITKSVTVVSGNTPPAAVHDSFGGAEDQTIGFYGSTLLANDVDAEGNTPLRITAVTLPTKGTLTYPADFSTFIYHPNANWFGTDSFTYTVSDSLGATAQTTVTLNVNSVNDAPVAVNDSFSVYKNQLLTMTQAQIVANDTDLEGHTITIYAVGAATNGTTVKLANGSIEYRPYGEFVGTDSFEYTIQDSAGGAYGSGRINVNVMQDTAPVASFTYSCTNLTCAFNASASTDDRGILTWQWTMGNNQSAAGATFNFTYGAAGSYTVRLTVTDALGQTGIISRTVTVTLPNAPPTAANDSLSGPEDGVISFNGSQLLANDSDSDGHTPLRITAVTLPANGTLTYPADFSSFSFRPNANWFGTSSFTYTVADTLGATAQGTVQLTVNSVNDGPVAGTDSFNVYKNQVLTLTPQQLLANDSDLEGHSLSVYAVGGAVNGTVQQLANGNIEYRPSNEFVGAGSFDYTLRDSFGASTSGRVNVTVLQDNPPVANFNVTCNGRVCSFDASATTDDRGITSYQWTLGNNTSANGKTFSYTYPVAGTYQVRLTVWDTLGQTSIALKWVTPTEPSPDAVNDFFSFSKGYARSVFYVDMLRNDTDPNGDTLSVISNSEASIGTVTCDATSCRFQPPTSFWYGQSTFTYTISDGHGKTDTATVTIEFRY